MVVSLLFAGRTSSGRRVGPVDVFPIAPEDTRLGRTIETWKMIEGRRADPNAVDEATASLVLARQLDLHVGDTIRLHFVRSDTFGPVALALLSSFESRLAGTPGSEATRIDRLADGPDVTFHIVGIEAAPNEFPPIPPDVAPPLHLTPAFTRMYARDIVANPLTYVRLHEPSELAAFAQGVERLAAGQPVGFITSRATLTPRVQRSVGIVANALRLLAVLTLLALVFVLGQTLLRQAQYASRDDPALRALGMTRGRAGGDRRGAWRDHRLRSRSPRRRDRDTAVATHAHRHRPHRGTRARDLVRLAGARRSVSSARSRSCSRSSTSPRGESRAHASSPRAPKCAEDPHRNRLARSRPLPPSACTSRSTRVSRRAAPGCGPR